MVKKVCSICNMNRHLYFFRDNRNKCKQCEYQIRKDYYVQYNKNNKDKLEKYKEDNKDKLKKQRQERHIKTYKRKTKTIHKPIYKPLVLKITIII